MTFLLRPSAAGLACLPGMVFAADTAVAQVSTFGALFQALIGLAVVLAALFGFLWLLRRLAPGQVGGQGVVKVVGGVMLGTRERLVVVEVGDQWLLIGVAAGSVSHLHTMARPQGVAISAHAPLPASFAGKLSEILGRRKQG